jgi:hypothetical protein
VGKKQKENQTPEELAKLSHIFWLDSKEDMGMIPSQEMHYSWLGFGYALLSTLGRLFVEKWFDILLALAGTWLGYFLAKQHIEHFISGVVKRLDTKYLELNRDLAFRKAVAAMLPELPQFYVRPAKTFSSHVANAVGEFTSWSTAIDATHTPEKSMEKVGKEAWVLAAELIKKDMGFQEAVSIPNYEWKIEIAPLPAGWTVEEQPDLTIYDWNTGDPVSRHATMQESKRTATSVQYSWMWDMKDVRCGLYVGAVNFKLGGTVEIVKTGGIVGNRVKVFLKREAGQVTKAHETVPWE